MKLSCLKHLKYFAFVILLQVSCNKNSSDLDAPRPFKASFTISEPFNGSGNIYPTDTIVTYRAQFSADDYYDSYAWTIGNDPTVRTTRSFILDFPVSVSGSTLSARLVAQKNGKSDTIAKSFSIYAVKGTVNEGLTPYSLNLPYLGKFQGSYEDAPDHKFVVTITNLDSSALWGFKGFRLLNIPEGCGGKYTSGQACTVSNISPVNYSYSFDYTYKSFYVNAGDDIGCCPRVILYGFLDKLNSNKIIIDCTFLNSDPAKVIKRRFIGLKI
jgi:hypothetical protein